MFSMKGIFAFLGLLSLAAASSPSLDHGQDPAPAPLPSLSRVKRIVGGHPADPPPAANLNTASDTPGGWGHIEDKPVVFVDDDVQSARIYGSVVGKKSEAAQEPAQGEKTEEKKKYYAFRGIPYAEPPLNEFRFQRPRRRFLEGDIEALKNGNPCLQPSPTDSKGVVGDEDCLTLNVYTPKIPTQDDPNPELLPVIFWIHGGGYRRGSGLQYDPSDLVMKNIVVVTVQYRLGSLGFLSSKQKDLPGNVGLLDIASALHWTRHYIGGFGGDNTKITAAGQGSGASSAMLLSLSKLTSDWVQGVVAMSGSAISSFAVDHHPTETYGNITKKSTPCGEKTGVALVKCLQEVGAEEIVRSDTDLEESSMANGGFVSGLGEILTPGPVVEGVDDFWSLPNLLESSAMDLITSTNKTGKIPMLTGVTKQETGAGVNGGWKSDIQANIANTKNFLKEIMPNKLLSVNKGLLHNSQFGETLKTLFSNVDYLGGISKSIDTVTSELEKVVQLTTDSLFNLPMFLTSKVWSLTSQTFVYSFEHMPKKSTASYFLSGLPIIRGSEKLKTPEVSHGEDLIYLFDAQSLDGNSHQYQISSSEDKKMRNTFTSLVAEFARTGTPQLPNSNVKWSPFSAQNSEFLVLSDQPKMEKEFRQCQMALWESLSDTLNSQKCAVLNLQKLLGVQKGLLGGLTGVNNAGKRVQLLQGLALGGGLPGGNQQKPNLGTIINPLGIGQPRPGQGGDNQNQGPNQQKPNLESVINPLGIGHQRPVQGGDYNPNQDSNIPTGAGNQPKPNAGSIINPLGIGHPRPVQQGSNFNQNREPIPEQGGNPRPGYTPNYNRNPLNPLGIGQPRPPQQHDESAPRQNKPLLGLGG